jgi:hypothetical protein
VETPAVCRILALAILATSLLSPTKSSGQDDPWLVLNKITHKRSYMIETRDRECAWGIITEVASDHLTAKRYASSLSQLPETRTVLSADVLRIGDERLAYYSGRSSWLDVGSLRLGGRERLKIVMKDGKAYTVKPPYIVSDEGIAPHPGRRTKIAKSEIAQVYEIVPKPLTATGEYLAEELGPMIVFDPDWYVWGLHLEQYVSVLVYDVSRSEDNSSAQCVAKQS